MCVDQYSIEIHNRDVLREDVKVHYPLGLGAFVSGRLFDDIGCTDDPWICDNSELMYFHRFNQEHENNQRSRHLPRPIYSG